MTLIQIPEDLYQALHIAAEGSDQAFDEMVVNHLRGLLDNPFLGLPDDEQAELVALHYLSNDALRTIAAEQMPDTVKTRMDELMDRHNFGKLIETELDELTTYVERGNRLMLRKAEAAAILVQRSQSI